MIPKWLPHPVMGVDQMEAIQLCDTGYGRYVNAGWLGPAKQELIMGFGSRYQFLTLPLQLLSYPAFRLYSAVGIIFGLVGEQ